MSRAEPPLLDVHRVSPVRGQLEPYDARTPAGTRYIQTTDTPDELKVLLPPNTATMYEQLLKLEAYELTKKPVSWERIMEIRHLKDRMIRKCQKLAKTSMPMARTASRGESFVFQTFVAPADFRVKEMEKWFRDQQKRGTSLPPGRAPGHEQSGKYVVKQIAGPSNGIRQVPSSSSRNQMQRSITNPEGSNKPKQTLFHKPLPVIQPSRLVQSERRAIPHPGISEAVMSPLPLPVLLPFQREYYGLDGGEEPTPAQSPPTAQPSAQFAAQLTTSPSAEPPANLAEASRPDTAPNNMDPPPPTQRPVLGRRPSCIKRNSMSEFKTVSWADNNELLDSQFSKYASAAREAQASGKFDEVRVLYLEQIAGLENLHLQVKEGLEHLRSETDHLQRIDETIRAQRGILDATFQEFEQKQALFQSKVQEALSEANEALTRQGLKRDLEPIHESK
ncbi:hypothetical protein CPC08DRAFT_746260 [Agrocybe pediades]|nr:hypothetical protein CPC08DRAFT_746260 [Agrocybe pediades]